jgi:hypothetical protein
MSSKTLLVIENHYLGAVLDRYQFDTFYHEHPRTYSLSSFLRIATDLGVPLSAVEFPSRYGGNIRVFLNAPQGAPDSAAVEAALAAERSYRDKFAQMRDKVATWKARTSERLANLVREHGPLPAKAFPGRAAILVKLLGIDRETVKQVHEKPGSMKIGHYLPGTRIPIVSDEQLFGSWPPVILNLAWHIPREIEAYLRQHGFSGTVVHILDPGELAGT